jgi:short-subunit dehydrogenase
MGTVSRPLAVVTGASSGPGFALARRFAEEGWDLVIADEQPALQEATERLRALGATVDAVDADLATADGCAALEFAVERLARPPGAVALAASARLCGAFSRTDLHAELNLIRSNVLATVRLAKWALLLMVERGAGQLILAPSSGGTNPVDDATFAFERSFAESLRRELADSGITVHIAGDEHLLETAGAQP